MRLCGQQRLAHVPEAWAAGLAAAIASPHLQRLRQSGFWDSEMHRPLGDW